MSGTAGPQVADALGRGGPPWNEGVIEVAISLGRRSLSGTTPGRVPAFPSQSAPTAQR